MEIIKAAGDGLVHARNTVAFDGSAGSGAIGTVTVFTITGVVLIDKMTLVCTEDLVGATATLSCGTPSDVAVFVAVTTATDIDNGDLWTAAAPTEQESLAVPAALSDQMLRVNVIFDVLVANITDGTIVVDAFYKPVTSNGLLA